MHLHSKQYATRNSNFKSPFSGLFGKFALACTISFVMTHAFSAEQTPEDVQPNHSPQAVQSAQLAEPIMVAIPGKPYEIGQYEVTQEEWFNIMGSKPSTFATCGNTCPVENISFTDISEFLEKLKLKTGKEYRLPTEEEWEYACYAGSRTQFCGSDDVDAVAWYQDNSEGTIHPVGQKEANAYGLHDMSGNAMELTSSCWQGDCSTHTVRGGSWKSSLNLIQADFRRGLETVMRYSLYGFRLARTLTK